MAEYNIGVYAGDGIGPEVIREGIKVLDAVASYSGFKLNWKHYPYSAKYWAENRKGSPTMFDDAELAEMGKNDAVYLGAIGDPDIMPESVGQAGSLLYMRFFFDEYINLRPAKLLKGVESPLKGKKAHDIDFYVVRENSEDFYVGLGARFQGEKGSNSLTWKRKLYEAKFNIDVDMNPGDDVAYQIGAMTGRGAERVMRYGFDLARKKKLTKVTVVDKANVMTQIYSLWRDAANKVAKEYPDIEMEFTLVDATNMWIVRRPETFQVMIAPNMFGDILSDLAAACIGGMGFAPGANINPNGLSVFEPIHGSAPKYGGQNKANPIATILAGKMMLDELGQEEAGQKIETAVENVLDAGQVRTYDIGGNSTCSDMGDAIAEAVLKLK